jgi:hypothetical protein
LTDILHPVEEKSGIGRRFTLQHAFVRWRLHRFVEPFERFLNRLLCRAAFSRWRCQHTVLGPNDFFQPGFSQDRRYGLYQHVLESEGLDQAIDYLEFGVATGHSIRWWADKNRHPDSRFVGFDTFTGLPEDYEHFPEGEFSTGGKFPDIDDDRVRFEAGLFQETLHPFLSSFEFEHRAVIHIDADLYSSTLFVLTTLAPRVRADDVILFDEFVVATHEFRAWMDFLAAYPMEYGVLGAVNNYTQLAVKVTAPPIATRGSGAGRIPGV